MAMTPDDLDSALSAMGIETTIRRHEPVLTVDEMMAVCGDLPGAHTKNLFLRDAKKAYFLVSLEHDAVLDLKALRPLIGARGNLSFASADALREKLGVISGAVSPLAIVNDDEGSVTVCLQDDLMRRPMLNVHPLTNDRTLSIRPQDLLRFLDASGHPAHVFGLAAGTPAA